MVFKIVSGVNKKVWDLYNSDLTSAEFVTAALDVTKQHPDHYKNRVIMNWSSSMHRRLVEKVLENTDAH